MTGRRAFAAVVIAWGIVAGRCSGEPAAAQPARTVTVFAAASLTVAFEALRGAFERTHPGVKAQFSFAGSPTLVQQIEQGAPADVLATADEPTMQRLLDGGHVDVAPRIFARNRLEIIVAAGNPRRIVGLADLGRPGLIVVLCGPTVPAGRYAREALAKAGVPVPESSQELDVKAVVSKVALGEADAGIAYLTDVRAAGGKVSGVLLPDEHNVVARYPIATLRDAPNLAAGREFVTFVLSAEGQEVLRSAGFSSP